MSSNWLRNRPLVYNPQPKITVTKPSFIKRAGGFLARSLKRICLLIGAMVLISSLFSALFLSRLEPEKPVSLPSKMVLVYKLQDEIRSRTGAESYLAELGLAPPELTLPQIIRALDRAATDDRVKGFVLTMRSGTYGLSQIQDLRDAVKRFRASGKFTRIYAPSYGEIGTGLGAYYLASSFDEIWMQPVGVVTIAGLYAQSPYFRGLFDRFGITPEFFGRKEYKTAMENFTSRGMSDASREMMQSVITSMGDQIASDIARDRPKVGGNFRTLMNKGLFTDNEALQSKLIDHINYSDVMMTDIRKVVFGKDAGDENQKLFVNMMAYALEVAPSESATKVAHIYINGAIIEHMSGGGYQFQDRFADAEEISKDIRDAARDKSVRAIMIDINSPGGSPSASETIRRAIEWSQITYKKPVYVVMRDVAASGGYWAATPANKIFARGTTMTGSIGVVGGKFNIQKLSSDFDVSWDGVQYGDNAGLWAMNKSFTTSEQERFEASLDNVYSNFVARVATGRKLSPEQAEQIARGRVWTGAQAKSIGLVDGLGGMDVALNDLAKSLGLQSSAELALIDWPREKSPIDAFKSLLGGMSPFGVFGGVMHKLFGTNADIMTMNTNRLVYEPEWNLNF
jgi:protease-4